jgi:hypothetical protein
MTVNFVCSNAKYGARGLLRGNRGRKRQKKISDVFDLKKDERHLEVIICSLFRFEL